MFNFDADNITLNEEEIQKEEVKKVHRDNWPIVVITLENMLGLFKNPIVKIVIGIVITVGNILHDRIQERKASE